jgi:hypothetical protein
MFKHQGDIVMKIGRLITDDGIEFSLESSQLKELNEYLAHQEVNEALAEGVAYSISAAVSFDPEDYERVVQAAYLVDQGAGRGNTQSARA